MFVNDSGQLFGKINVIDFATLATVALVTFGIIAVQAGWHQTSSQVVKGETDIQYTIFMRNIQTLDPALFEEGKTLSMTIRNQPRGEVKILKVERKSPKVVVPAGGGYNVVDDPTAPHAYNYLVTLQDHATVTNEGYVTNGVKVKTGMGIDVEGKNYRLPGIIVDVRELGGAPAQADSEESEKTD